MKLIFMKMKYLITHPFLQILMSVNISLRLNSQKFSKDYSTVLSTANGNEAYDNFVITDKSPFEITCPVKHVKVKRKYIK